ncbi:hypothetical protein G6L37_24025 [Agrobacterium rubi]|uniref:hypothetical protein n=1 Tax=Agrobacterium rubi TaxID=28099 RepID=UPI0015740402|nr:hypothetical protein [Agrobacterium rubi]NTF10348.1 hypothetical protein [Agrobacterium rubi]NTF21474.1 hypothetical protein [Agrobacterium rubi]NTF28331.1 hypothetical protein [Agrobacterium rubi]
MFSRSFLLLTKLTVFFLLCYLQPNYGSSADCVVERAIRDDGSVDSVYLGVNLSAECAVKAGRETDVSFTSAILQAGYVSALVGTVSDTQIINYLKEIVRNGDHGYFKYDADIYQLLKGLMDRNPNFVEDLQDVYDFVLAAREEKGTPFDLSRYAFYLPVWRDQLQRNKFFEVCSAEKCGKVVAISDFCNPESFMDLKVYYLKSTAVAREGLRRCNYDFNDPSLLLSLRRSGIVDSSCSASLQLNAMLRYGFEIAKNCSSVMGKLDKHVPINSSDLVRFVRDLMTQTNPALSEEYIRRIVDFVRMLSPKTADQINKRFSLQ